MNSLRKEDLLNFKNEEEKDCINFKVNDFMDLIYQYDLYEYTNDIYDDNALIEAVRQNLDTFGWASIKNMLSGICEVREDYFCKDGYGNFSNVTNADINNIIDNIIKDYDFSNEDEYEI